MKTLHSFRLAVLAAALVLGGCVFDNDSTPAPGESGLTSTWVGKSLDSLSGAASLAFSNGSLIVANRSATAPGVAVVDTSTGLITAYYPEIISPSSMAFTADGHLIVTESDHLTQGSVSVIDLSAKKIQKSVTSFEQDNAAVAADGKVFLFNHTTGAVTGFTGNTPGAGVVFDVNVGGNPQDIAITNGKAYIPRYNSKYLSILDPTKLDGGVRDSIDLSAYAGDTATHAPRMALVAAQGGYVFVAVQRLDASYSAIDTSLILVINASTKAIEKTIPLHFKNPITGHVVDGVWYISGIAGYDVTGGVEKIDLTARTNIGTVASASVIGHDVSEFVPAGAHTGYVIYGLAYPTYKVKKISF